MRQEEAFFKKGDLTGKDTWLSNASAREVEQCGKAERKVGGTRGRMREESPVGFSFVGGTWSERLGALTKRGFIPTLLSFCHKITISSPNCQTLGNLIL